MVRPRVPWEREWPYDAQKHCVPDVPDGHPGNATLISALISRQGPAHAQQWDHDMVVITQGKPTTRSWTRSFIVDDWNEEAMQRLHMEARRNYTHIVDRAGAAGAHAQGGQSVAWEPQ